MSAKKSAGKATPKRTQRAAASTSTAKGFTAEEREAMKEHARELKAAARRGKGGDVVEEEREVLAKIAAMKQPDRAMAERIHAIVKASAPDLSSRLWYGMPAYARDGKVICYFQDAQKFKSRYATLGFSDKANLDQGAFWPIAYAVTELTAAVEVEIAALVKRAVG